MTDEYRDKIDTERCHFCPKQRDIEAHHIVPQRFNGSDARENLVGVCDRCHKKLETLYDKRFYERLGIDDETGERQQHFECFVCDDRAEVAMTYKADELWFCVYHATERYSNGREWTIHNDLSGRMMARTEWIDSRYTTTLHL